MNRTTQLRNLKHSTDPYSHTPILPHPLTPILPYLVLFLSVSRAHADPVPILDSNHSPFPRSSLVDFSYLLDPPAGKHGFLEARRDGHFYFADGTRARFWGVNIAGRSVFQPPEVIDQMIDAIAKAGFNLVRLHQIDEQNLASGRSGLIDAKYPDSRHFDPAQLRLLDYWVARLKARGIYVYLDLLDYRTFLSGDDVARADDLGRGAKPYAVFNRRLIELQKEYARRLVVEHVNPFTGLTFAKDPMVVMLELFDENGLFIKHQLWRHLAQPYGSEFEFLWNEWLRTQYGSTEKLAQTWTNAEGRCALMPWEHLENNSIELPDMELEPFNPSRTRLAAQSRRNDGARFAYEIQRRYFRDMKSFLREIGVRIPLTAVTSANEMPDLKSVSDELDFIGNNFYWDHPFWPSGRQWSPPAFFFNLNPINDCDEKSFAPRVTISGVAHVPLVLREWNYCWPNRYRAAGIMEALAYGCLQDVDAMILFTLGGHEDANRLDFFDVHLDPARWGLAGIAAKAFLQRDVAPAALSVDIAYTPVDDFSYYEYTSDVYQLGFVSRLRNKWEQETPITEGTIPVASSLPLMRVARPEATLTIASGRAAAGKYLGNQQLLRANGNIADLYDRVHRPYAEALEPYGFHGQDCSGREGILRSAVMPFLFDGDFLAKGTRTLEAFSPLPMCALTDPNLKPIGVSADRRYAYGFYDPARKNVVFNTLSDEHTLKVALDFLGLLSGRRISRQMVDRQEYISDTFQIRRNSKAGRLIIDTPRFRVLAGNLSDVGRIRMGHVTIAPSSEVGVIAAHSLDSQPIERSSRIHIKFISNATNSGQMTSYDNKERRYCIDSHGAGPILTYGSVAKRPTAIQLVDRLIEVYQENGVWELVMEYGKVYFFSDTPNAILKVSGVSATAKVASFGFDDWREDSTYNSSILYPRGAAVVSIDAAPQ